MKKFLKYFWNVLQVLIVIYVVCVSVLILNRNIYNKSEIGNYTFVTIGEDDVSNLNNVKNGDLLIIDSKEKIVVGDTVYYYSGSSDDFVVLSDVVTNIKKSDNGYIYLLANSDYNILSSRIVGSKSINIHYLGKIIDVVTSEIGFIFLVLLPILVVFVYQLYQFIVSLVLIKNSKIKDKEKDEIEVL